MENPHRTHSLFWPIVLIGAGVLLLLRNLELIPVFNLTMLLRLWPLLLVVMGLEIIFGRRSAWVGTIIGLITVAVIAVFLVMSPNLGISSAEQPQTKVYSAPLVDVTSVTYRISTSADPVSIYNLSGSEDLINAQITNRGTMKFDVTGDADKTVVLSQESSSDTWLVWDLLEPVQKWDIGLSADVPTDLVLDGGSGALNVDLEEMNLRSMLSTFGSGASTIALPANSTPYEVEIVSGSGAVRVTLPGSTSLTLSLSSASGAVHIDIPSDAAVRIEVMDDGSGSLSLPGDLTNADGSTGSWQSAGYDTAVTRILIQISSRGSGSITIN